MPEGSIKLTRFVPVFHDLPDSRRQAWALSILAEGINMDDHVFVYHLGKSDDPIGGDKFECVASPNQMIELPRRYAMNLTTNTMIPFYRYNLLEYVCRSASEALELWNKIVEEVNDLVENLNASLILQATEFAEITGEIKLIKGYTMTPPLRIHLSYHPAGTPITVDDKPDVDSADTARPGWLPVSVMAGSLTIPAGAKFYYNMALDPVLSAAWPPEVPYSGNQLFRNGMLMPYGVVWTLTKDGLWWMDFDPEAIPGYQRSGSQEQDWGAPWPQDYATPSSPGAVPNLLVLTLFKQI